MLNPLCRDRQDPPNAVGRWDRRRRFDCPSRRWASSLPSLSEAKRRGSMTGKADFSPDEWETIAHGPPTAGLIVITAQRGGLFRETLALTRAYVDLHKEHGQSEL